MSAVEKVKKDILDHFAADRARVGHSFNARPFIFNKVNKTYNPKEQDAVEQAMNELIAEGLVEDKDGSHLLTQAGYDRIYG